MERQRLQQRASQRGAADLASAARVTQQHVSQGEAAAAAARRIAEADTALARRTAAADATLARRTEELSTTQVLPHKPNRSRLIAHSQNLTGQEPTSNVEHCNMAELYPLESVPRLRGTLVIY